jgi:predicted small metal-binding protein
MHIRAMTKYTYHCRDIGYDCSFEFEATEKKDLLPRIRIHSKYAHQVFELPPEMEQKIEAVIKQSE